MTLCIVCVSAFTLRVQHRRARAECIVSYLWRTLDPPDHRTALSNHSALRYLDSSKAYRIALFLYFDSFLFLPTEFIFEIFVYFLCKFTKSHIACVEMWNSICKNHEVFPFVGRPVLEKDHFISAASHNQVFTSYLKWLDVCGDPHIDPPLYNGKEHSWLLKYFDFLVAPFGGRWTANPLAVTRARGLARRHFQQR